MKTLVLSMISIAATVAAMTACTSESDEVDNVIDAPVEIKMSAGVMEITTKAAIEQNKAFDARVIASSTSADYTSLLWTGANAGNISVAEGGAVTFTPEQFYPANGTDIYMIGIAPQPTNQISAGSVDYTITGEEDIMYANQISGNKNDKTDKKIEFNHLLTQLKIKVLAENQEAIDAWGTITSIEVVNAPTLLTLSLKDGKIAGNSTDSDIKNLNLIGLTTGMSIPNKKDSEEAKDAGYCMVLPKTTDLYQLSVVTSKITTAVPITLQNLTKLEASTAYTVTLTFKSTNVDVTATTGEWKTDITGSGTVE